MQFTARQTEIIVQAINDSITYSKREKARIVKAVRTGTVNPLWIAWLFSYNSTQGVIYNEVAGASRDEVIEIANLLAR